MVYICSISCNINTLQCFQMYESWTEKNCIIGWHIAPNIFVLQMYFGRAYTFIVCLFVFIVIIYFWQLSDFKLYLLISVFGTKIIKNTYVCRPFGSLDDFFCRFLLVGNNFWNGEFTAFCTHFVVGFFFRFKSKKNVINQSLVYVALNIFSVISWLNIY